MMFLKIALFLCVVIGPLDSTLAQTNECTGPPPQYNNSAFGDCIPRTAGGCNCTAANETCMQGDRLLYDCAHDTELDFVIVCEFIDKLGKRYGWIVDNGTEFVDEFETCTGSEAPMKETTTPRPTASPFLGCIRLVESQTTLHETSGILQMYNDTWGSVCHTGTWNSPILANITCKMLGFSSYGSFWERPLPINQRPPTISTDAWEVNIDYCSGQEQTLWECELANNRFDWLTVAEFGSNGCPNLLKISCKVNTTLSYLTYCPPITTTAYPTTSVDHTEDSLTTTDPTASGQSSSGFSTGGIVAIVLGAIAGVVLLALVAGRLCCKRGNRRRVDKNPQRRTQRPPVVETDEQSSDNNSTSGEPAQEMRRVGESSDERTSNEVKDGTSGTAANQVSTNRDNSQSTGEPSATEPVPAGQPDSPQRLGSDMTPIDS